MKGPARQPLAYSRSARRTLERERIESLACAPLVASAQVGAHRGIGTPIGTNQRGRGVNRFTVDDIKRETVRTFWPLRCEVQDFDYDSGFEFSVFDAEDPTLVYMGKLRTSQYQDPKALAEVFRRWRIVVAAKGHELAPWTAPS
jgi:hypothetical protein